MSVLLDSCILIDHLRGIRAATEFLQGVGPAAVSEITWMEVLAGARDAESERPIRHLLSTFVRLPIDDEVAEEAVRIRRQRRMKLPDAIILATARVHRMVLATRNTRDFDREDPSVRVPYVLP